jgi:hypothetical protein
MHDYEGLEGRRRIRVSRGDLQRNFPKRSCRSYFCLARTKYLAKTTQRKKDLFWLMVSESSVHTHLPRELGQNVMAEACGGGGSHLMEDRK